MVTGLLKLSESSTRYFMKEDDLFIMRYMAIECAQRNWYSRLSYSTVKADSHIACRAHVVPLPCRAAKGLECVLPIWFTQCGHAWFTLAMQRPCPAPTMPFFSRPRHRTAVERRPVGDRPAFGFFRQPRGVPRRLSDAYQSQMQVDSVKPNNVCHGRGKEW
jgi:hypothetical protein